MHVKGNKQELYEEFCNFFDKKKDEDIFEMYLVRKETKQMRTQRQNNSFWLLFSQIANHLGYYKDDVKFFFLNACFGTKKIKLEIHEVEIPIISSTSDLSKEQGIFLIDSILEFCKQRNIPIQFTPKDIQSLYDSYN